MTEDVFKRLADDPDGLMTYEYLANHIGQCDEAMPRLVDNMIAVDTTGQFLVSAARYLAAIDAVEYADSISRLVEAAIDRDRERRYLGDLLEGIWGADYAAHVDELCASDNNFRRIYKRLHPSSSM